MLYYIHRGNFMQHRNKGLVSKTRVASRIQRHNYSYNTKEGQRISMLNRKHTNIVKIIVAIVCILVIFYLTLPQENMVNFTGTLPSRFAKRLPGIAALSAIFGLAIINFKKNTTSQYQRKKSLFNPLHVYTFLSQHPTVRKKVLNSNQLDYLIKKMRAGRASLMDLTTLQQYNVLDIPNTFTCLEAMRYLPSSLPVTTANMSNYSLDQLEQIVNTCLHFYKKHLTAEDIVYAYLWRMITPHQAWSLLQKAPVRLPKTEINVLDDKKSPSEILSVFRQEYSQYFKKKA